MWSCVSWVAVTLGLASTWVIPRSRHGWALAASSAATWVAYDMHRHIPAGTLAAIAAAVLSARNWTHPPSKE